MAKHIDSLSSNRRPVKPVTTPKPVTEKPAAPQPEPVITSTETSVDTYSNLFPEPTVSLNRPPAWVWWLLSILIFLALVLVGFQLANSKLDSWLTTGSTPTPQTTPSPQASPSTSPTSTPTPTATASSTPAPTPTATPATPAPIKKSAVTLRVLNGTTSGGAANQARSVLQRAGFTVRTIGNARQQNYSQTIIYYQSGRQREAAAVQQGLTGYSSTLQESSLASPDMVLVVIGNK